MMDLLRWSKRHQKIPRRGYVICLESLSNAYHPLSISIQIRNLVSCSLEGLLTILEFALVYTTPRSANSAISFIVSVLTEERDCDASTSQDELMSTFKCFIRYMKVI